jgi:hypothetical protein
LNSVSYFARRGLRMGLRTDVAEADEEDGDGLLVCGVSHGGCGVLMLIECEGVVVVEELLLTL